MITWKNILITLSDYITSEMLAEEQVLKHDIDYVTALEKIKVLIGNTIMGCDPEDGVDLTEWKDN
jgi:hypothetical protein